jgi:hypothetical protein
MKRDSNNLTEQIARETTELANKQAWAEIMTRLRAGGCSGRRATKLAPEVWLIRKRDAAARSDASA